MTTPNYGLDRFSVENPRRIDRREPVTLGVLLVVGLVFVVPALGWLGRQAGIPGPLPFLGAMATVGGAYALYVLGRRRLYLGLGVSLLVTSTFAANVPLVAESTTSYPGNLGPQLWLFQLPLAGLVVVQAARGEFARESFTRLEYVFGVFVLWTVASALIGDPPRQDTALYFSLFMAWIWLAMAAVGRLVRSGTLNLRQTVTVFLVAVGGHTAFAVVQYLNKGPFGLTVLGEASRFPAEIVLEVPLLNRFFFGVHLSGFTGGNGPLAVLLVMAIPLAAVLGYEREDRLRWLAPIGAVLMAVVLRLTGKDGPRGAVLVSFLALGGLAAVSWWLASERDWRRSLESTAAQVRDIGLVAVLTTVAVLLPSTKSGTSSALNVDGSRGSGSDGTAGDGVAGGGESAGTVDVTALSIPYFDLQSLGIRLQQYLAGLVIATENPVFGIGGGNYPYVADQYGLPTTLGGGYLFPLHSVYVALLAETGVPGFLLYVVASLLVLWAGWWLYRRDGPDKVLHAGLLAAVVGYLAVAFWVVNVRFTIILPFWLLGTAVYATYAWDLPSSESVVDPETPLDD